jgi:hypothetical protein
MDPRSLHKSVWALARRQHGVLARYQLLALGLSRHAIKHRIATGRLHPVYRGVYAVGRPQLTRYGRWMAAVLACGPNAALSHGAAGALWGLLAQPRAEIEVSVAATKRHVIGGIRVHRRASLGTDEITRHRGIPVTRPIVTLVDLARRCSRARSRPRSTKPTGAGSWIPSGSGRRSTGCPVAAGSRRFEKAPRPPHLRAHRLRARAPLPADSASGGPCPAPHGMPRQRLPGRLLLARARPDRRDRRAAIPPHAGAAGARSRARPGARCRRHDAAPLHPRPGRA